MMKRAIKELKGFDKVAFIVSMGALFLVVVFFIGWGVDMILSAEFASISENVRYFFSFSITAVLVAALFHCLTRDGKKGR